MVCFFRNFQALKFGLQVAKVGTYVENSLNKKNKNNSVFNLNDLLLGFDNYSQPVKYRLVEKKYTNNPQVYHSVATLYQSISATPTLQTNPIPSHLFEQSHEDVSGQRPLVSLVKNEDPVPLQQRVAHRLAQQHPICQVSEHTT